MKKLLLAFLLILITHNSSASDPNKLPCPTLKELSFNACKPMLLQTLDTVTIDPTDDQINNNLRILEDIRDTYARELFASFINQELNDKKDTFLHLAAKNNNAQMVKLLVYLGANVNQPNIYGNAPLHHCAMHNAASCIAPLIGADANVNQQNAYKEVPLHHAVFNNADQVIAQLIKADAQVNKKNKHGEIPFHYATYHHANKVITPLIAAGADDSIQNIAEKTALTYTPNETTRALFDNSVQDKNCCAIS